VAEDRHGLPSAVKRCPVAEHRRHDVHLFLVDLALAAAGNELRQGREDGDEFKISSGMVIRHLSISVKSQNRKSTGVRRENGGTPSLTWDTYF
jgi:hypothetical protein